MLLNRPSLVFCLFSFWGASAYAQEDDDGWLDDETEEKKAPEDAPTEGVDTAEIYREALSEYKKSLPEEELILWKKYLDEYPNSQFMLQIEKRMDELEGILYNNLDEEVRTEEAGKKELDFALPVLLESIDPRKKLRFAFEMGLPNYINLLVDYEHTLSRELSVHGGIRKRYAGWSAEGGAKYALIKSVRTDSLVTALGDVRINTNPFFIALRPQIAGGKSFYFPGDMRLDVMGQLGTEIQTHEGIQALLISGAQVMFVASETVRIYVEGNTYMKGFFNEEIKPFSFNTVTFGLKFRKRPEGTRFSKEGINRFEAGIGTTIPAHYSYWRYHYGSITGDVNLFMD